MRVVKSQLTYCLDLLTVLAGQAQGVRLTDLASGLHAPKSSTQRLLEHLAAQGWAEQDENTGRYRLTARLAVLGQRYLQSAGIADAAQSLLDRLARETGELARLTTVDGRRLVWIGSAQGATPGLRYEPSMGEPIVSFATANGKAWLATLPEEEALAIALSDGLRKTARGKQLGPNAMRSTSALATDLQTVRRRGYALSEEEAEAGVAAIAVTIIDPATKAALGTTSVAGPRVRMTPSRYETIARLLRSTADEMALAWPSARHSNN